MPPGIAQGPPAQPYMGPDQPGPLHSLPPSSQPGQYVSGMNGPYMGQAPSVAYPPQMGVAMDMSAYQNANSNIPPGSYPMAAPSHPVPQQQQAAYYQQPLL